MHVYASQHFLGSNAHVALHFCFCMHRQPKGQDIV